MSDVNLCLPANGGSASSSGALSTFVVSNVTDGDRKAHNWGSSPNGGWNSSGGLPPDTWIEVGFDATYEIHEVDVITLADDFASHGEPTTTDTFSSYGITQFEVQYWDGSAWQTFTGTSVTGNNKVWRQFAGFTISTTKVRLLIHQGHVSGDYARVVEFEAWGSVAGGTAYTDSGTSAATAAASGSDVQAGVSAGTSAASAAAPGSAAFAGVDGGTAVASASAAQGSDGIDHADAGTAVATAAAGGSDSFTGVTEYADADSAYAQARAGGSDTMAAVDAGTAAATASATGTSVNPALPTVHNRYREARAVHGLRQR
jgi:hypothetical protein